MHVLHRDVVGALDLSEVVDLRDVGVVQEGGDPRLVEEHVNELFLLREVRKNSLHHHLLLEAHHSPLACEVDLAHPAGGELLDQFIATEGL